MFDLYQIVVTQRQSVENALKMAGDGMNANEIKKELWLYMTKASFPFAHVLYNDLSCSIGCRIDEERGHSNKKNLEKRGIECLFILLLTLRLQCFFAVKKVVK